MSFDFDQCIERHDTDSCKWCTFDEDVLPLWVADMDFRSPEPVIQALHERVEQGVFGYGMEPPELREVITERLDRLYEWRVDPDAIVFVPGVVTGFNLACHAVAKPGDGVLIQTPVYGPILEAPANAKLTSDEMELTRLDDGRYALDLDLFEGAITDRTRVFILCNPHNPVGRVYRRDELERMAEICVRHDVVICSDEIHGDLILGGHRHLPIASLAPEVAERTITLMAPSKTFNIPGLKCSFAVVPNPELRKTFQSTHPGLVHGVNIMGYTSALAAYRDGQPWLDAVLEYLDGNLEVLERYVEANLPGIAMARPEGTYLAWLSCHDANIPGNPHEFFLREAKVAMNDGTDFGRGGEGFVRLNFACTRSTLVEALERMAGALHGLE